jgi:hypothetical protein
MRLVGWLFVIHGTICLLGAFFPFYPPVFLFYWFFPGPFIIKLIIVLTFGAAQVVLGIYWTIKKKVKWYWLAAVIVMAVLLMLIYPLSEGNFF